MAPGTYGRTWWRHGYACGCMIQSIEDIVEPRLRDAGYLGSSEWTTVFQYAYNTSVEASGGTHSEGGALDHAKCSDGETIIWRECGWADWQRGSPEDPYFDDHNHGIVQGCPHLSNAAADQVVDYKNGRDGLADGYSDKSPHVAPITWTAAYDKYSGSTGGVFGMTDLEKPHAANNQKITDNGEWQGLHTDDDGGWTLITGPSDLYVAVTAWEISDLAVGDVAQFRFCVVDDDVSSANKPSVIEYSYPIMETHGSTGSSYGSMTWTNDLGGDKSKDVKRRLRVFCKPPAGKAMTISDLTSRVAH